MSGPPVAAVVGPTGAGKTEIAIPVAERLGAEVVSIDSMQIYRGMDVGTAKPAPEERERVPHHLLDLRSPDEVVSVAEFQALARHAVQDISARGKLPLLVGGSGLYFRAVVDDLNFPPQSPQVRASFEALAGELGPEALYARLVTLDPRAAGKIEPGNTRRIVRALEVIEITGRPFSDNAVAWDTFESLYALAVAGLTRPRAELFERITARVDEMLAGGLEAEVEGLKDSLGPTARQALGYKQVLELAGRSRHELASEIAKATKRFARRQESWFKADPRAQWFDASNAGVVDELVSFFDRSLARLT